MKIQNIQNKQKKFAKGFTLLELLVVVVIIGVLAAIALPQYQLARDKAKYTQAMVLVNSIHQAQNRYILTNGEKTSNFRDLDIDMPGTGTINPSGDGYTDVWGSCWITYNYERCTINLGSSGGTAWYFLFLDTVDVLNRRQCWAYPKDNPRANRLCQALTGNSGEDHNSGVYKVYKF